MNRNLGFFAATSLLLTACGGGLQSPDFTPSLQGIQIILNSVNNPNQQIVVEPGTSAKLDAIGLFGAAPGTKVDNVRFFACPSSAVTAQVCTRESISGVTWSVDALTSTLGPVASIDAAGLLKGIRRGLSTVRARAEGFEATADATVDGLVLESIDITAEDARTTPTKSVPLGRTLSLSADVRCKRGFAGGSGVNSPQSNLDCDPVKTFSFTWSKPTAGLTGDYVFVTQPATGETVVVDTTRMGSFAVMASFVNEEGQTVTDTDTGFMATARVLDDITLVADPVVAEPVPVLKGTRTRITALGVFSDGSTDTITSVDVGPNESRSGQKVLNWAVDSAAIGGPLVVEEPGDVVNPDTGERTRCAADCPLNTSIIVTSAANAIVGGTGLTATGFNIETTVPRSTGVPGALLVDDRIALTVRELGLIRLSRICLAEDTGANCTTGVQVPMGDTFAFKVRGVFQGDPEGVERDIDPALIPIDFSVVPDSAPNLTQPADVDGDEVDDENAARGSVQGVDTLRAALLNGVAPDVIGNNRETTTVVTVVDQLCTDQFLLSNGTAASEENDVTDEQAEVTLAANVIDDNAGTAGVVTIGPSVSGGTIAMIFRRNAVTLIPPAGGAITSAIQMGHPADMAATVTELLTIRTLNAAGATVETFANPAASQPTKSVTQPGLATGNQLFQYSVSATQPFSGLEMEFDVEGIAGLGALCDVDPTGVLCALLAALSQGDSLEAQVFAACGRVKATGN